MRSEYNMQDKTGVAITAIVCLTVLEATNLLMKGPDGTILGIVIAVVAGLGGFILKSITIGVKESK